MRTYVLLLSVSIAVIARAQFGFPRSFSPETNRPVRVDAADLDGDGDDDIVAALQGANEVVVYLNDGSGVFGPAQVVNANSPTVRWVSTADLDSDGATDLLIEFSAGAGGVFAWHRNLGNGQFSAAGTIATSTSAPWTLDVGDIDDDGDLDVAVSSSSGPLRWFANNGTGSSWSEHLLSTNSEGSVLTLADLDGDGDLDLLMGNSFADAVVAWCANYGGGLFGPAQTIHTGDSNVSAVLAADLDNDGDPDVAYSASFPNEIGWFENQGNGVFGSVNVISAISSPPYGLLADDVDADGYFDLLLGTFWSNEVLFFHNTGSATFTAPTPLTAELNGSANLATADFDGDGDEDVLFCSPNDHEIGWIEQATPLSFGAVHLLTWSIDQPNGITLTDLDGDGDLDPVTASWADGMLTWYANDGLGNMGPVQLVGQGEAAPAPIQPGDLDNDGDIDLVVGSYFGSLGWYPNTGDGSFGPQQMINNTDTMIREVALKDLNGDGVLDVLSASGSGPGKLAWHANSGSGTFGEQQVIESSVAYSAVTSGDLDADGDNDVIAVAYLNRLCWYANDGFGSFGPRIVLDDSLNNGGSLYITDMDGNGTQDILMLTQPVIFIDGGPIDTLPRIVWFPNDGAGNFGPRHGAVYLPVASQMCATDVDGDSDPDVLLYTNTMTDRVTCLFNDGTGGFDEQVVLPTAMPYSSTLGAGDLDGDGDPDLVLVEGSVDRLSWFENFLTSPYRIKGKVFIDMDNNGYFNSGDTTGSFLHATMMPQVSSALTNPNGDFEFYTDSGAYTIGSSAGSALWALSTPNGSYSVNLTGAEPVSTGNDFGYTAIVDTSIIIPTLTFSAGPCGSTRPAWIDWSNRGTRIEQGIARLDLDPLYSVVSATPAPDSIVGNSYYWSFDSLFFFSSNAVVMELVLPSATSLGDTVNNMFTILRTDTTGGVTDEFTDVWSRVVTCAYDPNDKLVDPQGYGEHGAVAIDQDALTYTIRFQNTGNDTATNVMVRDQLIDHLDWSTLNILAASHPITHAGVEADGEAVFRFDNILLPDSGANQLASNGFVKFRISVLPGLDNLTTIENQAAIYFDFNAPVITNTTLTTLVNCELWAPDLMVIGTDLLEATEGEAYQWLLGGLPLAGETAQVLFITGPGDYSVTVRSIDGCLATSDVVQIITTGVNTHEALRISVVPNPFASNTRVILSEPLHTTERVELVDVNGRVLHSTLGRGQREVQLNRGGLASGLYAVRICGDAGCVATQRLVVE